jgi:hypothetical protein
MAEKTYDYVIFGAGTPAKTRKCWMRNRRFTAPPAAAYGLGYRKTKIN